MANAFRSLLGRASSARARILLVVVTVAVSACYGPAAVAPKPSDQPPEASDQAIRYPADNMWAFLASTPDLQRGFGSLHKAVAGSDAVVVGRFVGLERGQSYSVPGAAVSSWHAIALIQPDEVISGKANLDARGLLRVEFVLVVGGKEYPEVEFANLSASIPGGPALLFLVTMATYFDRAGGDVPEGFESLYSTEIYRTVGGDGAIRIENGVMEPPSYIDGWPLALAGIAMSDVETTIRAVNRDVAP